MTISNIKLIRNYPDGPREGMNAESRKMYVEDTNHDKTWLVCWYKDSSVRSKYFPTLSRAKNFRKTLRLK